MNPLTTELANALQVMTTTPHIRAYLEEKDPMALKQGLEAISAAYEAEREALRPKSKAKPGPKLIRVTMEMTPSPTFPVTPKYHGEMAHNVWDLVRRIELHLLFLKLDLMKDASPHSRKAIDHELEKAKELIASMKIEVVNQE